MNLGKEIFKEFDDFLTHTQVMQFDCPITKLLINERYQMKKKKYKRMDLTKLDISFSKSLQKVIFIEVCFHIFLFWLH